MTYKSARSRGGPGPSTQCMVPWAPRVNTRYGASVGSTVCCTAHGRGHQTDRQTDRQTDTHTHTYTPPPPTPPPPPVHQYTTHPRYNGNHRPHLVPTNIGANFSFFSSQGKGRTPSSPTPFSPLSIPPLPSSPFRSRPPKYS